MKTSLNGYQQFNFNWVSYVWAGQIIYKLCHFTKVSPVITNLSDNLSFDSQLLLYLRIGISKRETVCIIHFTLQLHIKL